MHFRLNRAGIGVLMLLLTVSFGFAGNAFAAKQIEWKTLLPQLPPLEDPLATLPQDQRFDFHTIAWARALSDAEKELEYNRQPVEDAAGYERKFRKSGHDVDDLLRRYKKWEVATEARQKQINKSLNGQKIRMSGYILPINFTEAGATDFLLVPYLGACVHTPPPPPNQIVFVRLARKFKVQELYTPVWITGQMQAKATSKSIELSDGNRNIDIGYHVEQAGVELYKQ